MTISPIFSRLSTPDWPKSWRAAVCVWFDRELGLISVEHDGSITWDELQDIKDRLAGSHRVAIEVYPPRKRVVNCAPIRHLWLLGPGDWWPDLGREGAPDLSTLRDRYVAAQIVSTRA